jgi:hypothetical protein
LAALMAIVVQNPALSARSSTTGKTEMPIAQSKFLMDASYDPQSLQLTVTMKNGAQYIHFYVYPAVMEQFMTARSKGEFYSKNIKGKHPSTRVITKAVGKKISQKSKTVGR